LHAAVFAIGAAVPTVAIAYDPKVEALLSDAGLGELVEPFGRLSAETLGRRLESAHREGDRFRAAAAEAGKERRAPAERGAGARRGAAAARGGAPPISPEMLALLDEGLAANLLRTHELSAAVEVLRADRTALELKSGDLEARVAAAESIEATLRGMNADLAAR